MYIKTGKIEGETPIREFEITDTGELMLHLITPDPHDPEYVRLNFPEVGAILFKLLLFCTERLILK